MPRLSAQVGVVLVSALLLTSCELKGAAMSKVSSLPEIKGKSSRGSANVNPQPTAGYRMRLKIEKAPGSFEIIEMGAQYDVRNEDQCGKIHPMTGTPGRLTTSRATPLTRISPNEYEGVLYLDRMLDEDYFGRGVCHWEMSSAVAHVVAGDRREDTIFSVRLDASGVVSAASVKRYYANMIYPRADGTGGIPFHGKQAVEEYLPHIRSSVFSLTLTSLGEAK